MSWEDPDAYEVDPETGCWIWQRSLTTSGYARVCLRGRTKAGHRLHFERVNGPIPKGLQLDHLCRNRACVNPDHLEPVTGAVNVRRGNQTTLTQTAAAAIRAARGRVTQVDLAAQFGVNQTVISSVQLEKTWRDPYS